MSHLIAEDLKPTCMLIANLCYSRYANLHVAVKQNKSILFTLIVEYLPKITNSFFINLFNYYILIMFQTAINLVFCCVLEIMAYPAPRTMR